MKRTNIEMDEKLIETAKKLTGIKTCKDLVDYSLRQTVRREKQKRILDLFGKIHWEGDLVEMRSGRGLK